MGVGRVAEDRRDGGDARVDEALDAGLGIVEGLELAEAAAGVGVGVLHYSVGGRYCCY